MAQTTVAPKVISRRKKPGPVSGGSELDARADQYGNAMVIPLGGKQHGLADEESYFIATNPVPGTGLATIAALQTLVDTSPFILIQNGDAASADGPASRLYLDYVKLEATAPGTAGTSIRYAVKTDVARADRYTSGGTQLTPQNPNQDSSAASPDKIYCGALVAAAAPQSRLLGSGLLRPVIPVIGDTYMINFGGLDPSVGGLITSGTTIAAVTKPHVPVILGPQQWCAIHLFLASQSAASSYEVEIGYWRR